MEMNEDGGQLQRPQIIGSGQVNDDIAFDKISIDVNSSNSHKSQERTSKRNQTERKIAKTKQTRQFLRGTTESRCQCAIVSFSLLCLYSLFLMPCESQITAASTLLEYCTMGFQNAYKLINKMVDSVLQKNLSFFQFANALIIYNITNVRIDILNTHVAFYDTTD